MTRAQTNHDRVIGRRRQLTLPCFLVSALLANELTAVNRARGGGAMPDVSRPLALPLMSEQTHVRPPGLEFLASFEMGHVSILLKTG